MKNCKYCGHENEDDALFCVIDGSILDDSEDDNHEDKQSKLECYFTRVVQDREIKK